MNLGITDWAYLVALIIFILGFWIFVIWFLLRQGGKRANNETQFKKPQRPNPPKVIQPKAKSPFYRKDLPLRRIKCDLCDGYYVERWGSYGLFAGCSNFAKERCKSSLSIKEFIKRIIAKYGVNIYTWKTTCDNCGKEINVHSYLLLHDLAEHIPFFEQYAGEVGVGDIPALDAVLASKVGSIKKNERGYFANLCSLCYKFQSHNSVVSEPHGDILNALWGDEHIESFLFQTLQIESPYVLNSIVDGIIKKTDIDKIKS